MSIQGRGEIEFDKSELNKDKKATDSTIAALNSIRMSWEIRDDISSIERNLKNAYALGHHRAKLALSVIEKCGNRPIGVVDVDYVQIVVPTPVFEKLYSLFEALLMTADEKRIYYALRGDFDLGIQDPRPTREEVASGGPLIPDHRPTPEEFASGAPLISDWVAIYFSERSDPNFN